METALVKSNGKGKDITTSLIVAEVFGKRHNKRHPKPCVY